MLPPYVVSFLLIDACTVFSLQKESCAACIQNKWAIDQMLAASRQLGKDTLWQLKEILQYIKCSTMMQIGLKTMK